MDTATPRTDACKLPSGDWSMPDLLLNGLRLERELTYLRDEKDSEISALQDVLLRNGFVRCDIPACNCGSWHARYGLPERMQELKDALDEAGHPLCNQNGNLIRNALNELIAERDSLRNNAEELIASAERVKVLEVALRPFVALLQEHHERCRPEQPIFGINNATITKQHLMDALQALGGAK